MVIVVFRSRLRTEVREEYYAAAEKMLELARHMPGFVSYKAFHAEDGERVSIHEWESQEALRAWREHPEHKRVQKLGREEFFEEYTLYAADNPRTSSFERQSDSAHG